MIKVTVAISQEDARKALLGAGFHADAIVVEGGLEIHGANPARLDEYGGPAIIDEADRASIEAVLNEASSRDAKVTRARELAGVPTLTQSEIVEALKILLSLIED